jgi:hypothetical protein
LKDARFSGLTHKINTDNELGFAFAGALDLGSGVGPLKLLRNGTALRRRRARRISLLPAKAWRRTALGRTTHGRRTLAHAGHIWRRVSDRCTCVDGRRSADHLAWRGTVGALVRRGAITRAAGRIVGRVARRAIASWVIHWETGGRGRGAEGRRLSKVKGLVLRYLTWRRGACGRDPVGSLDAGG